MERQFFLLFFFTLINFSFGNDEILKKSDMLYIPEICKYELEIETLYETTGKIEKIEMKGFKKGRNENLIVVNFPKSLKGIVHLRKDNSIFTYYPSIKKAIKTAYQSIIQGTTLSYGDVIALDLSIDYEVESLIEENNQYKLELKPRQNSGGYAKIIFWMEKNNYKPIRREYYSLSGDLLKECNFKKILFDDNNKILYLEIHFYEPFKKAKSIVTIKNIVMDTSISDKYFNPVNLSFFSGE